LVIIGIIIFASSFVSGGLLINLGMYGYFAWFIGLILVVIGLWRNDKEKNDVMKKTNKYLSLILIIAVIIAVLIIGRMLALKVYEQVSDMTGPGPVNNAPPVTYTKNETAGTITITSIEGNPEELLWSNVEVYNSL
jgi:hypothetical protein